MHKPAPESQSEVAKLLKASFAEWAPKNYRVRKPTPEEMYEGGMDDFYANVPLLAEKNPELLQTIITHFNRLIDTYEKHYEKPKFLRTLVTDRPLSKKSSEALSVFYTELLEHREKITSLGDASQQEFWPGDYWKTVYVQACHRYQDATGHHPIRPQESVGVRDTRQR